MKTTPHYCRFNQGTVTLPEGYLDRTVNVFIPEQPGAPTFNISRDCLNDEETAEAYIDHQLLMLNQQLTGWKLHQREAAWLGDQQLAGECVHTSYLYDGRRICQQQAIFAVDQTQLLMFTLTKSNALNAADTQLLNRLLSSFALHR